MAGAPPFAVTTRLVARALGIDGAALGAALRTASLADLPALLALRAAERDGPCPWDDGAYLRWRYRLGRPGAGLGEAWVLELQGRVIGVVGTEDLACTVDGTQHHGLRTMDLLVHPEARSSGLGAWLNQALLERTGFALVVGANESSRGIVQRLFEPLPPMVTYTHPLAFGRYARRSATRLGPLALLGAAADPLTAAWRAGGRLLQRGRYAVRPLDRLDAEADAGRAPGRFAGPFDLRAAPLQPRLMENPRTPYLAWGAFDGAACVGHVAARVTPHAHGGADLHVADLDARTDDRPGVLTALLAQALREAAARRCVTMRVMLQERTLEPMLKRVGLLRRGATLFVGVQSRDAALRAALLAAPWALTERIDDNDGFH